MAIHPLALVDASAQLGRDVSIGPFAVIEAGVVLGDGCCLESHVVVKRDTQIGANNRIGEGTVIGGLPQHTRIPPAPGIVRIGSGNVFREHVTIHRAMEAHNTTLVGDNCLVMAGAHIAHDCRIEDHVILANHATLGGFVTVEERAFVSGNVAIHQFCRVGRLAMVGGLARVIKEVPPYVTIDGTSGYVVGLNTIGLRRSGHTAEQILDLKRAYRITYRAGLRWPEIIARLQAEFPTGPAARFHEFFVGVKRGIVPERRLPPGATIKLHDAAPAGDAASAGDEPGDDRLRRAG